MTTALRTSPLMFVVLAACTAAACGGNAELALVGPSVGAGTTAASGATISGRVNGGSGLARIASSTSSSSAAGLTVTIAGTSISAPTDARGSFTLTGVPSGPVQLQFSGPGVNASVTITVNGAEQIQLAVTISGNSARIESQHRSGPNNRAELVGRITEIDAAARTVRVSGTLVAVPADAVIRHGSRVLAFTELLVGDQVEVRGTLDGNTLRASEIKVESVNRDELTERRGTVSALSGTCPALTFTIGTTRVVTNGSTFFKDAACTAVANSAFVEVKGRPQADGSLLAVRVEVEDEDEKEAEVKGVVSGLNGTCPALTFTIGTTRVATNGATVFRDGLCSAVVNGTLVEVKGRRQADGSLLAAGVEFEHEDEDETRVNGVVSGLSGTCPAVTFSVAAAMRITTTAMTRFDRGCSAVQNGRRVEIRGVRQSDGSIVASRVKMED